MGGGCFVVLGELEEGGGGGGVNAIGELEGR